MSKIVYAKYRDRIIHSSEYNESVHYGEISCLLCNPPVPVTCVLNDFFRAMPKCEHNCGKTKVDYLDSEWEGNQLIERITGDLGEFQIIIDINKINNVNIANGDKVGRNIYGNGFIEKPYEHHKIHKKVLRDIVRNVIQMKKLLVHNDYETLNKIKFIHRIGEENLVLDEIVKTSFQLTKKLAGKTRFVLLKVFNVVTNDGVIYFNSFSIDNINCSIRFNYSLNENKTKIKQNDFVLVFGKITYSSKYNKFFIDAINERNLVKISEKEIIELFENKTFDKPNIERSTIPIKNSKIIYIEKPKSFIEGIDEKYAFPTKISQQTDRTKSISSSELAIDRKHDIFDSSNVIVEESKLSDIEKVELPMIEKKTKIIDKLKKFFKL